MRAAIGGLFQSIDAATSVPIRWTQNGLSVTFQAVPGSTIFDTETDDGVVQTTETRDWLFPPARLVLGGTCHTPARGARVEQLDSAGNCVGTFTVAHPGGDRHYRYADQFRQIIRVHTVEQ